MTWKQNVIERGDYERQEEGRDEGRREGWNE
jgi:hypothetical protein